MSWHPNPEINRQRQQNWQDWQRERARDGGGFTFPPCGCVMFVVLLVFGFVTCCSSGGAISSHCTPEMSATECAKAVVKSVRIPF